MKTTMHVQVPIRGLQLDYSSRRVAIDGELQPRRISKRSFQLLAYLATRSGETFSREEITAEIYGQEYVKHRDDDRLDALIENTRKRIGDDPRHPRFLETIRGKGHRLNEYRGNFVVTVESHAPLIPVPA